LRKAAAAETKAEEEEEVGSTSEWFGGGGGSGSVVRAGCHRPEGYALAGAKALFALGSLLLSGNVGFESPPGASETERKGNGAAKLTTDKVLAQIHSLCSLRAPS
jgi:hypothetical protein